MNAPIEIWHADLDELAATRAELSDNLDAGESACATRLVRPLDRARFCIGRGWLRELLSQRLGQRASQIAIAYGAWGKPFAPDFPDWHFNVAHSNSIIIVAIARGRKIGVDIERVREGAIISSALAPAERLNNDADFLQLWTFKEAFLKARGDGLTVAPADVDTSDWRRGCLLRDEISGA